MSLSDFFIDVTSLPDNSYGLVQLLFLAAVYGYCLTFASNLISDGSELLLLIPAWAGLIGSIVLPVLGAVPDGCIVLFSGIGPNAQEQLNVGVGALAGSTIMLLTLPWFLSIVGGRVNIDPNTGNPRYKSPKLDPPNNFSLSQTGVTVSKSVNAVAYIVLLTSVSYFLLQIPGLVFLKDSPEIQAKGEKGWAQLGVVVCTVFFFGYLYQQYLQSSQHNTTQELTREDYLRQAIANKTVTLAGVMTAELIKYQEENTSLPSSNSYQQEKETELTPLSSSKPTDLISNDFLIHLERILKPFFKAYDTDNNGTLSQDELVAVFSDMGEKLTLDEVSEIFIGFDLDKNGLIDYKEFVRGTALYIKSHDEIFKRNLIRRALSRSRSPDEERALVLDGEEEEEEEEEEMPDDIKDLSPEEQQWRIKLRAFWMMALGTIIVLIVSDPTVEVMSELGKRTGIPSFYIAFVLAPLASNASELIAAYNYAQKKTVTSISISLATLEGAAIMNNTFVLGIFMALIATQSLVWEFFAETLTILFVQVVIAIMAMKSKHTLADGFFILSLYPISLAMVAILEAMGWD